VFYDVTSVGSGANIQLEVVDGDGDHYTEKLATSTGDGYVQQVQLGDLSVESDGDGSFGDIEKVRMNVTDADATVEISALNVDRLSPYTLGVERADTDDDDDLEDNELTNNTDGGKISIKSKASMGSVFDGAMLHDVTVPVEIRASELPDSEIKTEFTEDNADYPNWFGTATVQYRLEPKSAYDVSWSNLELVEQQSVAENRIISVEYAEGTGDTNFSDIDDTSFTDKTDLYTTKGDNVTLDGTGQPGTKSVVKYQMKLDENQFTALQQSGGGGGPFGGGQSGGLLGWFMGIPGAVLSFIGGTLGIRALQKRGS
jgi:hypothetical protein